MTNPENTPGSHVCTPTAVCRNQPCPLDDALGPVATQPSALPFAPLTHKELNDRYDKALRLAGVNLVLMIEAEDDAPSPFYNRPASHLQTAREHAATAATYHDAARRRMPADYRARFGI